ncbi:hypothetical protein AVEN_261158-1 [Araneus ventricosus]|uniref:Uncharacterized protein n=1 Tax=Araneus ventricosus TaxID=182803 RepID=A0A4Y2FL45_ARAVE|nr:hypothetical protein AVEN_261158-1 [Araneus ventricosus]
MGRHLRSLDAYDILPRLRLMASLWKECQMRYKKSSARLNLTCLFSSSATLPARQRLLTFISILTPRLVFLSLSIPCCQTSPLPTSLYLLTPVGYFL